MICHDRFTLITQFLHAGIFSIFLSLLINISLKLYLKLTRIPAVFYRS